MRRLLDYDPLSGLKTWHDFDPATQQTIIHYEGDSQGVLDQCKEDSNHADRKLGDGLVHVARVPPEIQLEWFVKHGVAMWDPNHRGAVNRLLDGDYKHLKRLPIQIGNYR
jgi:hypothetical protein